MIDGKKHFLEPFHVPHVVFLILAWLILVATIVFAVAEYPKLPNLIPTHFGFDGIADDWHTKSFGWLFVGPIVQLVLSLGLSVVYRYPYYANIPGTIFIKLLPKDARETVIWMVRHLTVLTMFFANTIFAYITIGIIAGAYGDTSGLNPWIIFGITGLFLLITIGYSIAITKYAHRVIKRVTSTN